MTALESSIESVRTAAAAADRMKAADIAAYDVSDLIGITDCMLLASATKERQVLAVDD
ncbi:MAG: RsfS/YbeB/iojap family protein [Bifidobacterium castoris]|nr:RsfS/YbeB/iojap family protein [Bifidobacterium castoris]